MSTSSIFISFRHRFGMYVSSTWWLMEEMSYLLSKRMLEYEKRYVMIKCLYLALVWATKRLRHYMIEYSMHLISYLYPLRYLFDRLALIGRLMRWLVFFTKFDILEIVHWWYRVHPFDCASNIHIGAYFPISPRFLVVVGWYGYPYSWLYTCLMDFDRFFIVHQISILGRIHLSLMRLCLGNGTEMDDHCWSFTSWLWH